jgi:hypothetical protein
VQLLLSILLSTSATGATADDDDEELIATASEVDSVFGRKII